MDDRDFFDTLYQVWSKTTGAENRYWMYESDEEAPLLNNIYAVGEDGTRKHIASGVPDEDANFITGIHGALADLVRRLHAALDEADEADYNRDSRECLIAELEMENAELRKKLEALGG